MGLLQLSNGPFLFTLCLTLPRLKPWVFTPGWVVFMGKVFFFYNKNIDKQVKIGVIIKEDTTMKKSTDICSILI